jgi:hypothetical protein
MIDAFADAGGRKLPLLVTDEDMLILDIRSLCQPASERMLCLLGKIDCPLPGSFSRDDQT